MMTLKIELNDLSHDSDAVYRIIIQRGPHNLLAFCMPLFWCKCIFTGWFSLTTFAKFISSSTTAQQQNGKQAKY